MFDVIVLGMHSEKKKCLQFDDSIIIIDNAHPSQVPGIDSQFLMRLDATCDVLGLMSQFL